MHRVRGPGNVDDARMRYDLDQTIGGGDEQLMTQLPEEARHWAPDSLQLLDRHFPAGGLNLRPQGCGVREHRLPELEREGIYPHTELFEIQKKFSIPFACLVFGLVGLALGASNRRDGKLASFVVGLAVIFGYYVLLWLGQSMLRGHLIPPWLGAWAPNIIIGGVGALLFLWGDRGFDRVFRMPSLPRVRAVTVPPLSVPMVGILDRYVATLYARVAALSGASGILGSTT